jgi:hypothetical protein
MVLNRLTAYVISSPDSRMLLPRLRPRDGGLAALLIFLVIAPMNAATYYVSTSGNDANTCTSAQNLATPKRKIMGSVGGIACMTNPGDKLYIRGGTYSETITNTNGQLMPSGTSWSSAFTVAAYPGEKVILTQGLGFGDCCQNAPLPQMSYWIFDGLHLISTDPNNNGLIYNQNHVDHIRFINLELTNNGATNAVAPGDFSQTAGNTTGNCLAGGGGFLEFINIEVHDCGAYGIYFTGHDTLFDHFKVHGVYGYGFHIYNSGHQDVSNNIVRNSKFYDIRPATPTGTYPGAAILLASGSGSEAYNNVIWNSGAGIGAAYGTSGFKIFNNTIFNVLRDGITVSNLGIGGATIKNNIISGAGGSQIVDWTGVNPATSNNFCGTSGYGCAIVGNPQFVNSAAEDFHLLAISGAINSGVNLSPIVITDIDGVARPQGAAYDIGAYEYTANGPSRSTCDLNGDSATNVTDVQLCANQVLRIVSCSTGDINRDGACNVVDVQRVVNAALGEPCVSP